MAVLKIEKLLNIRGSNLNVKAIFKKHLAQGGRVCEAGTVRSNARKKETRIL